MDDGTRAVLLAWLALAVGVLALIASAARILG